jgi:hypothetical protein
MEMPGDAMTRSRPEKFRCDVATGLIYELFVMPNNNNFTRIIIVSLLEIPKQKCLIRPGKKYS